MKLALCPEFGLERERDNLRLGATGLGKNFARLDQQHWDAVSPGLPQRGMQWFPPQRPNRAWRDPTAETHPVWTRARTTTLF